MKTPTRNLLQPSLQPGLSRTSAQVLDEIEGVVWEMDADSQTFKFVNSYAEKLLGYVSAEWLERGFWRDHIHPDDRRWVIAAARSAVDAGATFTADYRMVSRRGDSVWVRHSSRVHPRSAEGERTISGFLVNISNLKLTELALRESDERYTQLAEASTECIIHHENGRIIDVNPVCERLLGYTRNEMIGRMGTEFTAPEDRERLMNHIRSESTSLLTGHSLRKDGSRVATEVSGKNVYLHGKKARVAILRDITERRQMQEELRLKELDYRTLLEEASDAIVLTSADYRIIGLNPRACEMAGMCEEEALGRPISDFLLADDLRDNPLKIVDLPPGSSLTVERPMMNAKGQRVQTEISARKLSDGRVLAIIRDVTERRKTEKQLTQALKLIAISFQTSRDAMVLFRLSDDGVIDVNDAWVQLTGVSKEEIIGRGQTGLDIWVDSTLRARYLELLATAGIVRDFEFTMRTRSGEMKRILVSAEVIELDGEKTVLAVQHDATDQLRLENELVQSQKLEAVGRFAGSIAHDFNNILTGILAFSELAALDLKPDDSTRLDIEQIQKAAKRAASLTRQLLTFARPQPLTHNTLNLNDVITDLEPMLRGLVGERSGLLIKLASDLANVRADVTQMEQLLVNLVVNARDAMPDRGVVTIDTSNSRMPATDAAGSPVREAVQIVVCDTGVGMSADVRDRIFEPFFTTKTGTGGTGLGLSTVYGIVKQGGGSIQVESEVDVGTTFRIYLPATKERETVERKTPAEPVHPRARVLVVDEDAVVRTVVKRILEQNGYDVTEAQSGEDALWLIRAQKLEPELLITDLAMPVTDGGDLARKLKAELPGLCVLLMSDFSGNEPERMLSAPAAKFIQKPFDSAELLRAVNSIFAEQRRQH